MSVAASTPTRNNHPLIYLLIVQDVHSTDWIRSGEWWCWCQVKNSSLLLRSAINPTANSEWVVGVLLQPPFLIISDREQRNGSKFLGIKYLYICDCGLGNGYRALFLFLFLLFSSHLIGISCRQVDLLSSRPTDRPDHRENDIRCLWHRCLQNFMECAHLLLLLPTEELTTNSWVYDISNSSALSSVIEVTVGDVCKLPGMSSTMCSGFCGCSVWQSELINFIYLMCKFHFLACSSSHPMVITCTFVGTFSQHKCKCAINNAWVGP